MRKTLKRSLTGGMLLTTAASMLIVFLCLLIGTMKYSTTRFANDMADVFSMETLTELNAAAVGTDSYSMEKLTQAVEAYSGQLRIGAGREYTIWNTATGEFLAGSMDEADAVMTDNVLSAMNGNVGDTIGLFSTKMDIAIPINGTVALVLDVQDDGSEMRALCSTVLLIYLAALVLAMLLSFILSMLFAHAFTRSAVETAKELRQQETADALPTGDWEALAAAMLETKPSKKQKTKTKTDRFETILPYLSEGYVQFRRDGEITYLSDAAAQLLHIDSEQKHTFAEAFPGVPMPTSEQKMVHGQFTCEDQRLDVVFLMVDAEEFAAVLRPVRGYAV